VIRKHALRDSLSIPCWEALFKLRRELEPVIARLPEARLKVVVDYWRTISIENGASPPDFDSAWATFKQKLATQIKEPFGAALARVVARIPNVILPPQLVSERLKPVARVMIAFSEEAERRRESTFRATYRLIGPLAGGIGPMTVMYRLGALSRDGFLSLVEAGTQGTRSQGKASTWQWHDPPRPCKTVWNSNKAMSAKNASNPRTTAQRDAIDDGLPC
jgi:hypothetical protein